MKPIPDEKQIEEMLTNLAPEPNGRLERRLAHAPWTPRMVTHHLLINTAAVCAFLAVVLFIASTPQGHAFAQSILQFFVRTEGDTRPVPTLVSMVPTPGATGDDSANPALGTRLPFEETCGDILHARCGLDEIRAMTTFPISGLVNTVDGLTFAGATGGPEQVMLVYTSESVNGALTITQEPAGEGSEAVRQVAASADVETVSIDGVEGEYVQGSWLSIDTGKGIAWTADPFVQTLRWQAGSVLYTMVFRAGKDIGSKLDKADMLYLAGQLIDRRG